ncbi:MAG: rRNA maturation RNase YbeY [Candidatus Paceibacterota bacterium]
MVQEVLPGWDISLVFAGEIRAKALNIALRNKDYIPNVLSYETGKKSGEIIICPSIAKKQAPEHELPYKGFLALLFIHGLLHLKGQRHGATMEKQERQLAARFTNNALSNVTTHSNRN